MVEKCSSCRDKQTIIKSNRLWQIDLVLGLLDFDCICWWKVQEGGLLVLQSEALSIISMSTCPSHTFKRTNAAKPTYRYKFWEVRQMVSEWNKNMAVVFLPLGLSAWMRLCLFGMESGPILDECFVFASYIHLVMNTTLLAVVFQVSCLLLR